MAKVRSPLEGLPAKVHLVLNRMQGRMSPILAPGAMLAVGGRMWQERVDASLCLWA